MTYAFASTTKAMTAINTFLIVMAFLSLGYESTTITTRANGGKD